MRFRRLVPPLVMVAAMLALLSAPAGAPPVADEFGGLSPSSGPRFITAGPDGNLWFTESFPPPTGGRIGVMNTSGVLLNEYVVPGGPPIEANSIVAGPDGNLWFTDFSGARIFSISTAGVFGGPYSLLAVAAAMMASVFVSTGCTFYRSNSDEDSKQDEPISTEATESAQALPPLISEDELDSQACAIREGELKAEAPLANHVSWAGTVVDDAVTDLIHLADGASVPDGAEDEDGTVWVYFISAVDAVIHAGTISDGEFEDRGRVEFDGVNALGFVDPDINILDDGTFVLTFLGGRIQPGEEEQRAICLATSNDGTSFEVLGTVYVLQSDQVGTDPSLIPIDDGWMIAWTEGPLDAPRSVQVIRSIDGAPFEQIATVDAPGIPELTVSDDSGDDSGDVTLYVSVGGGCDLYTSTDGGESWVRSGRVEVATDAEPDGVTVAGDPSVVRGPGGTATETFIFKALDATIPIISSGG